MIAWWPRLPSKSSSSFHFYMKHKVSSNHTLELCHIKNTRVSEGRKLTWYCLRRKRIELLRLLFLLCNSTMVNTAQIECVVTNSKLVTHLLSTDTWAVGFMSARHLRPQASGVQCWRADIPFGTGFRFPKWHAHINIISSLCWPFEVMLQNEGQQEWVSSWAVSIPGTFPWKLWRNSVCFYSIDQGQNKHGRLRDAIKWLKFEVKQKLKDQFLQKWHYELQSMSSWDLYCEFKGEFKLEEYVLCENWQFSQAICNLSVSNNRKI